MTIGREDGRGSFDGVGVQARGHARLAMVTAAIEHNDGKISLLAPADDHFVAFGHLFRGQAHLPEAVLLVHVGTGDPNNEVCGKRIQGGWQSVGQRIEILRAAHLAGKSDIVHARFLGAGIVAFPVDRVGEDAFVAAENGVRPVALMGIGVGDENAKRRASRMQVSDGHGHVVEYTVAESAFGKGMVGSSGQIGGHAVGERVMAGGDGGGGLEGRAVKEARLPRQSQFGDLGVREHAIGKFAQVFAGVNPQQLTVPRRSHGADFHRRIFGHEKVVGLGKFFHRERMAGREWQEKIRMIEAAQSRRHGIRMQAGSWRGKPSHASWSRMDWISPDRWAALAEEGTDAHRLATAHDGWLDRYGDWILWSGGRPPRVETLRAEAVRRYGFAPRGYLARELVKKAADQKPAELLAGEESGEMTVREGGLAYLVEPAAGYSSGLFLDQYCNRRWVERLGAQRMLNLFAYTCSFTVCAAASGAQTCSVDAAKRVLGNGRRNLELNGIDPADGHRFLVDDATKVVPRLAKRGESFDLIVLDPPTFGRADGRVFRIEKDLPGLVDECFELLVPGGHLLVCANFAAWSAGDLRDLCADALGGRACRFEAGECPEEIADGAVSWRLQKAG